MTIQLISSRAGFILPTGLIVVLALAVTACASPQAGQKARGPMVLRQGAKVRDFIARDRDGKKVHLGSYVQIGPTPIEQPREVLLTFFATWCRPCRHELPLLAPFQKENEGKVQVILVAVPSKDVEEQIDELLPRETTPFPVVVDRQGTIFDKFFGSRNNSVVPCSYLIDPQGRVILHMTGFHQGQSITRQLFEARRVR